VDFHVVYVYYKRVENLSKWRNVSVTIKARKHHYFNQVFCQKYIRHLLW